MNLKNKKKLAARILNVGMGRIKFDSARLDDIKEAITRQDILDLRRDRAIKIKAIRGQHVKKKRKYRRGPGKVRKRIGNRKGEYCRRVRLLRKFLSYLKKQKKLSNNDYRKFRVMIKAGTVKDKRHLKELVKK